MPVFRKTTSKEEQSHKNQDTRARLQFEDWYHSEILENNSKIMSTYTEEEYEKSTKLLESLIIERGYKIYREEENRVIVKEDINNKQEKARIETIEIRSKIGKTKDKKAIVGDLIKTGTTNNRSQYETLPTKGKGSANTKNNEMDPKKTEIEYRKEDQTINLIVEINLEDVIEPNGAFKLIQMLMDQVHKDKNQIKNLEIELNLIVYTALGYKLVKVNSKDIIDANFATQCMEILPFQDTHNLDQKNIDLVQQITKDKEKDNSLFTMHINQIDTDTNIKTL